MGDISSTGAQLDSIEVGICHPVGVVGIFDEFDLGDVTPFGVIGFSNESVSQPRRGGITQNT